MDATVYSKGITADIVKAHGLNTEEYERALNVLGRPPNLVELGIFSVMWSEHCSYKSSKKWLRRLPTSAPWVIQGPGENAGVIDIGEGLAAVFKMESHNHPSYIEPYQGAATGVGGILRDVFTMGARPIANLNALRFGDPRHPKTRHLVAGVVAGIGGYGNCVGVPTVGGEVNFHSSYNGNCLVNAMTVGVAPVDRIFTAKATGIGNPVVYVGSKTGRDGIHGATMASAEFTEDSEAKRPTVQVGDPFTEKLLIEACMELMATDAIVAIQDMGAAGLTSSSFEMASKGGLGVELKLDQVPCREDRMTPYEIMLSESQERMLMILKPGRETVAEDIFRKWQLDFAVIGHLTDTGRMVLRSHNEIVADLPIDPLAEAAPEYDRPWVKTPALPTIAASTITEVDPMAALRKLMHCPDVASRRWIWEQYDHMVGTDTAARLGGDAAVVRLHGSNRGLAMTTDCTPRYVQADPQQGGRQAIVEAWRNLTAVGALPLAVTDNMNFGNPERPEIMGQFVGAIEGMREACLALDFPVISGNVSLYNETEGKAILPTPAIGAVGLIKDLSKIVSIAPPESGLTLVLLGKTDGWLGCSLYLREIHGREEGAPPPVDLSAERKVGDLVRNLIHQGTISACHDLSDGGLAIALAEMCLAGNMGASISLPSGIPPHAFLFGEDQARYLVATAVAPKVLEAATKSGVTALILGQSGGDSLKLDKLGIISVDELRQAHESWLPGFMAS
jgi:phosphoribosylformylglycinamidine synthase II